MKFRKLLILSSVIIFFASCRKEIRDPQIPGIDPPVEVVTPKPYTIVEGFETGSKTEYKLGDVQLNSGIWSFKEALIGNLAADAKEGSKSVRLRTGDITMKFDISGVNQIRIKHAKYGIDANQTWRLLMSDDGGATYKQLGSDITETNTTLVADSFAV